MALQPSFKHNPRGSLWHRWDLHFHTPSSFDYDDSSVTNKDLVEGLVSSGVHAVVVTDHHVIDVERIKAMQTLAAGKLAVLPGIELRDDHGDKPVHYICIFPEDCDLNHVWTRLQGALGLTPTDVIAKGGDQKVYIPIEKGAALTRELGGIVTIHAGAKSNSLDRIDNAEQFQQRIKYDILKEWVDFIEIGQVKDIEARHKIIFPSLGFERPLILCSDNHNIRDYLLKAQLWLRADPTFRGLKMVMREPRHRAFIGDKPPDHVRVEQNKTKYVRGITFTRKDTAPVDQSWFSGSIEVNPGLVAIVGNKGSGKSAFSDMLGLLGACKNPEAFSFLSARRFRHPSAGFAKHFEATVEWETGEKVSCCLADSSSAEAVERLKYLPQDHVEKVCNELEGIGERNFEQELKSVIFSHVPEAARLGQKTLDDLVRFQTGEKQKRIDSLLKQLKEVSRSRAALEIQADPNRKKELEEKVKRKELELEAHEKIKPAAKEKPDAASGSSPIDPSLVQSLAEAQKESDALKKQVDETAEKLRVAERRNAVAQRLSEKLDNFQKEFSVFASSLHEDAAELSIDPKSLAKLEIDKAAVTKIQNDAASEIDDCKKALNEKEADSLKSKLLAADAKLVGLQSNLDAPNRAYQAYLKELSEWEGKRSQIDGTPNDAESLTGLRAAVAALVELPGKIDSERVEQRRIALEIHAEKLAQAAVYRGLYEPVQTFIDTHELAKNKLRLEFRAELTNGDFTSRLLNFLALNRKGSFMGLDEGRIKADDYAKATVWSDPASVGTFLESVDTALHRDEREAQKPQTQLRDQLLKGKRVEEVFDTLYGLEYIEPRYILRWEGKDISMLSPGERGTLLLVFYLLIDKGDMPLIIDQPEGNLDNHTVAKVLVDCIREARKKRQVFIVTHNPNLAVVCDADQVIHAEMDKANGNKITYTSGALENPVMSKYVTDVLEGTLGAFSIRDGKYKVGN